MTVLFTNNASASIAASINTSDTTINLATGQGSEFPSPAAGEYFYATLVDSANNLEIVKCTNRSGDSLTVVRAQDGTSARAYSAGSLLELRLVAKALSDALTRPSVTAIEDKVSVVAAAATGTINFDWLNQSVVFYTTNATANWVLNIRGDGSNSFNSVTTVGTAITITFMAQQGSTAYFNSSFQIDGTSVTPKWQGGITPTTGNVSSIDTYTYAIVKTAANTYTVLASVTKFA